MAHIEDFKQGDIICRVEPDADGSSVKLIGLPYELIGIANGMIYCNYQAGRLDFIYCKFEEGWEKYIDPEIAFGKEYELDRAIYNENYERAAEILKERSKG